MSKRRMSLVVVACCGFAFAAGFVAAPTGQPDDGAMMQAMARATTVGEHHKALEPLLGNWEGTVKFWMAPDAEPQEFHGSIHREWALDGRYIFEHVTSEMPGGSTFRGMGIIGYNTVENVYESVWLENQSTYMSFMTGKMDPEKHTMSFTGKILDPVSGQRNKNSDTLNMSDPKRHVSVGYSRTPDGKEYKCFEGVMEKVD
ncbi:MAG: DUF1579 domain-containing protein [Leptolyngbya sp. PLA3]|nr:MAG: DUF1579 domain-containing protein [Cyanobacteria bacterium CYA]MCE7967124.1 DUF1579 domain-containing protein [Leptolyngbya sp. PL-A3]